MDQKLKSELTKQVIIDGAFKLFYENGFKSTSIGEIMKATSLTKGAFYHHYASKEALGLEVITHKLKSRVYDAMILPLYDAGSAIEILETTFFDRIRSFSPYFLKHGCPMNNFINEVGDYESSYQTALKEIVDIWKAALVSLIDRCKEEGSIREEVDSAALSVYLISAFEGIRGIRKLYDDNQILDHYVNGLRLYFSSIKVS